MCKWCPSCSFGEQNVSKLGTGLGTCVHSKRFPSLDTLSVAAWTLLFYICEQGNLGTPTLYIKTRTSRDVSGWGNCTLQRWAILSVLDSLASQPVFPCMCLHVRKWAVEGVKEKYRWLARLILAKQQAP